MQTYGQTLRQGFSAGFPEARVTKTPQEYMQEMQDEIPFSGGPWILEDWNKQELTLSRNENYWGDVALLDEITFVRRQNQETELNSLKSGEVSVIFPQPSNVSDGLRS